MQTLTLTKQRMIPLPLILADEAGAPFYLVPNGGWYTVKRTSDNKMLCEVSAYPEGALWLWSNSNPYRPSRWNTATEIADYICTLANN